MLRYRTKELVDMFDVIREALRAADEGTVKYMIEEQRKEIEEKNKIIAEQNQEIEKLKALLNQANKVTE